MAKRITIALDAMGGDHAPRVVLAGAERALRKYDITADFILFGDEEKIKASLKKLKLLPQECRIVHTAEAVKSTDRPAKFIRNGEKTSMAMAIKAVADGEADCVVSGGNTGALMVMARKYLGMLPEIERPAIAAPMPAERGNKTIVLDLGANVEVTPRHLVQFGIMGAIFSKYVLEVESPRIGLLNVGSEAQKGHKVVKETATILKTLDLPGEYKGFAEGNDITKGTFDVVVTDGFTGNILLKATEGTAKLIGNIFRYQTRKSALLDKLGLMLAAPALRRLKKAIDPRRYNGAMFLGLGGICVKSHGGMDKVGFSYAIRTAADLVKSGFLEHVNEELPVIMAGIKDSDESDSKPVKSDSTVKKVEQA